MNSFVDTDFIKGYKLHKRISTSQTDTNFMKGYTFIERIPTSLSAVPQVYKLLRIETVRFMD